MGISIKLCINVFGQSRAELVSLPESLVVMNVTFLKMQGLLVFVPFNVRKIDAA